MRQQDRRHEQLRNFIHMPIWKFRICFTNFLLVFDCGLAFELLYVIHILFGFKNLSIVITCPLKGLGWQFPVIATQVIILCEPLLHHYT